MEFEACTSLLKMAQNPPTKTPTNETEGTEVESSAMSNLLLAILATSGWYRLFHFENYFLNLCPAKSEGFTIFTVSHSNFMVLNKFGYFWLF